MPSGIQKVAGFLNKPITTQQIETLANHLHIDNFRKAVPIFKDITINGMTRENEEGFVRKGTSSL